MHWQYRTICRGPNSILQNLYDVIGLKAHDYISFHGLRAHGRLTDGGPVVTSQVMSIFLSLGACFVSLQGAESCSFGFHIFVYGITSQCRCSACCHDAFLLFIT